MFAAKQTKPNGRIDTLIGAGSRVEGDIHFVGGLRIDGAVKGNVIADDAGTVVAEHEVLVTDPAPPVVWAYPVPTGSRPRVTVRLTGVGVDGARHPQPPLTTSDLLVVASLPDVTATTEPATPPG